MGLLSLAQLLAFQCMGDDCQSQKRVDLAADEVVHQLEYIGVGMGAPAAAALANLLSRDSHLQICISGIARLAAKRLLPTLTMKMVGFFDGDLSDSKLILHRPADKQEKFEALSFGKDMATSYCHRHRHRHQRHW